MAEEQDGETTFSPTNSSKEHLNADVQFHKTASECQQRTSGTQKSSQLSSKGDRKNIKDKKRDKRDRDEVPSQEGSLKKERHLQTPGNSLTGESVMSLGISD